MRDKIEPAHDLTFFCFFLPVFLDIEDLRDGGNSVEVIGMSGFNATGEEGSESRDWDSFDEALVGRLWGEESSWPKNAHFLDGNLGVEGLVGALGIARSVSKGLERCLRGLGRSAVGDIARVPSNLAAAVFGRPSVDLGLRRWSLEGGLEADIIEDKLPETE